MVRFKPFSFSALLLFPAFVLLLLTVISAPITRFSSLGSASNTKFGVFGYCYTNGSCSSIQIGYDTDSAINRLNTGALSKRQPLDATSHFNAVNTYLYVKRQNQGANNNNNNANQADAQFNLPENARENLSNILVVHVVACGLTLIWFVMAAFGNLSKPSSSPGYMLVVILLSVITVILTLLSFLVDILIFVPNLDWGTWITLVATVLNAIASVMTCAARRTLKTRQAMRKRIAENDDMNTQNYYNSQHLHDDPPPPAMASMEEADKATLPHFAQYDFDHHEAINTETMPLTGRTPDDRSVRSETASLTSPPRYPANGQGYRDLHEMQELQSPVQLHPDPIRARIPYGNPPQQRPQFAQMPSRQYSHESNEGLQAPLAAPLAHASEPIDHLVSPPAQQYPARVPDSNQILPRRARNDDDSNQDWESAGRRDPAARERRQRVVSGPRPMPNDASTQRPRQRAERSLSGSYYEDVLPQFDQAQPLPDQDDNFLEPLPLRAYRQHTPKTSATFERPPYPQQPRSPDTISNSSNFTSVSQRGINPAWRGDGYPQGPRKPQLGRPPRQERRRATPTKPNILADNPDFTLPGAGASRNRLPGARRPNAVPALSASGLGKGESPYAITKGM